ncbi:hypothetical protein WICPIJ_001287, partial [Wickerhamomyces pijperi]
DIVQVGCGGQFSVSAGVKLTEEQAEERTEKIEDFEESLE